MSGALIDLAAVGIQDTYLTGDPKTTYFRQVYKQHTNFSSETIRQVIEGDKSIGGWSEVNVSRNGDLLTDLYFLADASTAATGIATPFTEVQLLIGGKKVDTITDVENCACAQVFRVNSSSNALAPFNPATLSTSISLQFFFGRCFGNALPLVALQYHDITLRIKWNTTASNFQLYGDYIHLDNEERNSFIAKPINMLIEQHQRVPLSPLAAAVGSRSYTSLEFSHPVKAIYSEFGGPAGSTSYSVIPSNCEMRITFNGKELTPYLPAVSYYSKHQIGKHTEHSASDTTPMYSFALYANRQSPTGSCNFSRIDNARMELKSGGLATVGGSIYALNWNVLNIENGMGGLLFAN